MLNFQQPSSWIDPIVAGEWKLYLHAQLKTRSCNPKGPSRIIYSSSEQQEMEEEFRQVAELPHEESQGEIQGMLVRVGVMCQGRKEGKWTTWDLASKNLTIFQYFSDGLLESVSYSKDSRIIGTGNFKQGLQHGISTCRETYSRRTYKDGLLLEQELMHEEAAQDLPSDNIVEGLVVTRTQQLYDDKKELVGFLHEQWCPETLIRTDRVYTTKCQGTTTTETSRWDPTLGELVLCEATVTQGHEKFRPPIPLYVDELRPQLTPFQVPPGDVGDLDFDFYFF